MGRNAFDVIRGANSTKRLWLRSRSEQSQPPVGVQRPRRQAPPPHPLLSSAPYPDAIFRKKRSTLKTLAYTLKHHPRARRVKLRVDPNGELTVTAPRAVSRSQVDGWVAERRSWVESVRARQARLRSDLDPSTLGPRPDRILLPAIGEEWRLSYREGPSEQLRLRIEPGSGEGTLHLDLPAGPVSEVDGRIAVGLRLWLRQRASQSLRPMIAELADRHGFSYASVSFRNQKTRWGSCSAKGRLSINARLLLASPGACRYVLIHELVHTEHLNHSSAFWARLAAIDPDYRAHEHELDRLGHRLPDWL